MIYVGKVQVGLNGLGFSHNLVFWMCPMFSGPVDKPGTCTYSWLVTIQIKLLPLSVSVQVAGVCVPCDVLVWPCDYWGEDVLFFCQRKWKVRNSILYWYTEMQLLTLTYYFWPYNSHPPKGGPLLHIYIHQLNVWFSLSLSTGFLFQTTDMCLEWIGDSKLTSGVNVSVNACSPYWPFDLLKARSESCLLPKGSWAWLQPPAAL